MRGRAMACLPPGSSSFPANGARIAATLLLGGALWLHGPVQARAADDVISVTPVSFDRTPAYGSFTPRRGRWYGRATPVRTGAEAARLLNSFYAPRGLRVKRVVEHPRYYEAHVTRGQLVVDRVILLKRTGRIRSVY